MSRRGKLLVLLAIIFLIASLYLGIPTEHFDYSFYFINLREVPIEIGLKKSPSTSAMFTIKIESEESERFGIGRLYEPPEGRNRRRLTFPNDFSIVIKDPESGALEGFDAAGLRGSTHGEHRLLIIVDEKGPIVYPY